MSKRFSLQMVDADTLRGGRGISTRLSVASLAEHALGRLDGTVLFTYLFRRFGFPNYGSDADKDIASYLLTSRTPGLYLEVRPSLCNSSKWMFAACVTGALAKEYTRRTDGAVEAAQDRLIAWAKGVLIALVSDHPGRKPLALLDDEERATWLGMDDNAAGSTDTAPTFGVYRCRCGERAIPTKTQNDRMLVDMVLWNTFLMANPKEKRLIQQARQSTRKDIPSPRDHSFMGRLKLALIAAMRDLERPTSVHDVDFNCHGRVTNRKHREPYSPTAGFPVHNGRINKEAREAQKSRLYREPMTDEVKNT